MLLHDGGLHALEALHSLRGGGVVDEYIYAAELGKRRFHQGAHAVFPGDVGGDVERARAREVPFDLRRDPLPALSGAVRDHDLRTLGAESPRDAPAHSLPTAGDDRDSALQAAHDALPGISGEIPVISSSMTIHL